MAAGGHGVQGNGAQVGQGAEWGTREEADTSASETASARFSCCATSSTRTQTQLDAAICDRAVGRLAGAAVAHKEMRPLAGTHQEAARQDLVRHQGVGRQGEVAQGEVEGVTHTDSARPLSGPISCAVTTCARLRKMRCKHCTINTSVASLNA